MKKTWILLLTLILLLSVSWCAQAGIYVESMVGGSWDVNGADGDLSATIAGFDYGFDSFKLGLEYIDGTWKDFPWYGEIDFSAWEAKIGYDFLKGDHIDLYGTLSYFKYEYDDFKTDATGIIAGVEFNYAFGKSSVLEASAGLSVNGEINYSSSTKDADVFLFKLKYNYYFTDNLGLNIGYRHYEVDEADSDTEFQSSGFTLGLKYRF